MNREQPSAALVALYELLGQAERRKDTAAISGMSKKMAEVIILIKGSD